MGFSASPTMALNIAAGLPLLCSVPVSIFSGIEFFRKGLTGEFDKKSGKRFAISTAVNATSGAVLGATGAAYIPGLVGASILKNAAIMALYMGGAPVGCALVLGCFSAVCSAAAKNLRGYHAHAE